MNSLFNDALILSIPDLLRPVLYRRQPLPSRSEPVLPEGHRPLQGPQTHRDASPSLHGRREGLPEHDSGP